MNSKSIIVVKKKSQEIQIHINEPVIIKMKLTKSNQKLLLPLSQNIINLDGNKVFTLQKVADSLEIGKHNRQNVSNQNEKFNNVFGKDYGKYLNNKKKLDVELQNLINETITQNIFITKNELINKIIVNARKRLDKILTRSFVEYALRPYVTILKHIRQKFDSSEIKYKEKSLIDELFQLIDKGKTTVNEKMKVIKDNILSLDDKNIKKIKSSQAVNKYGTKLSRLKEELFVPTKKKDIDKLWNGFQGKIMLVFILYMNGISTEQLGKWFGVHKKTISNWMKTFHGISKDILKRIKINKFSGIVHIDEKWIKIKKKWYYWSVALDGKSGIPLYWKLLHSTSKNSSKLFLLKLKKSGYYPKLIVTDGLLSYRQAIKDIFPNSRHQLCLFHILKNGFNYIRKTIDNKRLAEKLRSQISKFFKTENKNVVKQRLNLFEKNQWLAGWINHIKQNIDIILPAIGSKWIPKTNNKIERFFREFNRFYVKKAGFSSIESCERHCDLFVFWYVFKNYCSDAQDDLKDKAPLQFHTDNIVDLPFYHMLNYPDLTKLPLAS